MSWGQGVDSGGTAGGAFDGVGEGGGRSDGGPWDAGDIAQDLATSGLGFMSALQRALCRPEGDDHALELLSTIAACCEVKSNDIRM